MPAVSLTVDDLVPFATIPEPKAQAMIDSALARAARVAPCIRDDTLSDDHAEAAKDIIRDAVLRRNEAGTGALASQSAGPFAQTMDTRTPRKVLFWPSEIQELQSICSEHSDAEDLTGAFSITPACSTSAHMPWCALAFGALYCSCGGDLTNYSYALYEGGVLSDDEY